MVRHTLQLLLLVIVAIIMSCHAIALPVLAGCFEPPTPKLGMKYCGLRKNHLVCAGICLSGQNGGITIKCNLETGLWVDGKDTFPDCEANPVVVKRLKRSAVVQEKISSYSGENQKQPADRIEASGAIVSSGAIESSGAIQPSTDKQPSSITDLSITATPSSLPASSGELPKPADRVETSGAIQTSGEGQNSSTGKTIIVDPSTVGAPVTPKDRLGVSGEQPVSSGEAAS